MQNILNKLKQERDELEIKINKLTKFILDDNFNDLVKDEVDKILLQKQLVVMEEYSSLLFQRIHIYELHKQVGN